MNSLPKTVIRQRRDCDLNPWPFRTSVQHANHSATEPTAGCNSMVIIVLVQHAHDIVSVT